MTSTHNSLAMVHTCGKHLASRKAKQGGAVLAVGLILLVVLLLWGVQAMRNNTAQERMATNMGQRNMAFQAAEAALRVGESAGPFDGSGVELANPLDWVPGEETASLVDFDKTLASDPMYHIGPPQYVRVGLKLPPKYRLIYPVNGKGEGQMPGSIVILQSGVEPPN